MKIGLAFLKSLSQVFSLVMALCLISPFLLHAQVDLSKPSADFPAHYILLIDKSGSMTRGAHRAKDVADIQSLVSERIPELIIRPEEHGISLPPYRLGKDYLSVLFFGIPKAERDFGNLLHPAVIFWSGTEQFQILKKRITADLFNAYYSAISVATPLSLALIKETLSQPKVLADPKLAEADLRFSRTVGIILTDAKENLEGSSLNVLEYLAGAGVQGSEEARTRIQQVRRYSDYESNVRTFPGEGQTGRFLIGLREFVPKEVALPNLVAKITDVALERFAPTPSEIFYKGQIDLNFLSPDQLPYNSMFKFLVLDNGHGIGGAGSAEHAQGLAFAEPVTERPPGLPLSLL